jgi:hypothetical protein
MDNKVSAVLNARTVREARETYLDTGVNEVFSEDTLNFGLAGLEIVSRDEGVLAFRKLNSSRYKCVGRTSVHVRHAFENGSNGEDGRGRNLLVRRGDGGEEVVGGVVDAVEELRVALGVGGPENDNLIEVVLGLKLADVAANLRKRAKIRKRSNRRSRANVPARGEPACSSRG